MLTETSLVNDALAVFAGFTSEARLYELQGDGDLAELQVEAWSLREGLDEPWDLWLSAVGLRAGLDVNAMLGRKVTLLSTLADGSKAGRAGIVTAAVADEADGGLARYRLRVQPWLSLLAHTRRSQVWQERSLVQICESVFSQYDAQAAWSWSPETVAFLADSAYSNADGLRSYTVQYRESDLAFVTRLFAEEGLTFRFDADDAAPFGHRLVIVADTTSTLSCPEDATSLSALGGTGVRFHRASSREEQDAVQAFGSQRRLQAATSTVLAWDYKGKKAVAASVPTAAAFGGANAPRLEHYDPASPYAYASSDRAERAARLHQESLEARHKAWLGRSTVRTFTAGRTFALTESTLDALARADRSGYGGDRDRRFLLTSVTPRRHQQPAQGPERSHRQAPARRRRRPARAVGRRRGAGAGRSHRLRERLRGHSQLRAVAAGAGRRRRARRCTPSRARRRRADGHRRRRRGRERTASADEIHTDALGRIRIQFHFQAQGQPQGQAPDTGLSSTWVRVLQRYAGAGMGLQFIPRIGQEVLVEFIEGDIDRPLVIGALYNGRGEAGTPATPGGQGASADLAAFALSGDHAPSAQGNLAGGNSPAWHGASPEELDASGQRNAAAISGFKSKEFGGAGYNHLAFDDSDAQLRAQLATTQHASQLNLGHLIHQADNHRGSFRGLGFELRTDAYGAIRAKSGVLLTSYGTTPDEPAGDNAPGIALANQLKMLAATLSGAAKTHEAVQLAGHIGTDQAGQSSLDGRAAPLAALHVAMKGMVSQATHDRAQGDAAAKNNATGPDQAPHLTDPIVTLAAKAGLAVVAGQDVHLAAGEGVTLASGNDSDWAVAGALRVHAGQRRSACWRGRSSRVEGRPERG